jgi:hypothetical protein
MAKIASYKLLLFAVATFVIALGPNLLGSAFAWTVSTWTVSNNYYSHGHNTVLSTPNAVCGDHKCAPGEIPQHPPVVPVKGVQ